NSTLAKSSTYDLVFTARSASAVQLGFGRPMAQSEIPLILAKWDATAMLGLCTGTDWMDRLRSGVSHEDRGRPELPETG
ncbi:hypothetical protein, partial [Sphingobium sp. MK2]|uniref:hypothetical protein n=1 Tax=Sphingobium sp. MK2 TaxID=3116540 RepID=UPI0032E35A61